MCYNTPRKAFLSLFLVSWFHNMLLSHIDASAPSIYLVFLLTVPSIDSGLGETEKKIKIHFYCWPVFFFFPDLYPSSVHRNVMSDKGEPYVIWKYLVSTLQKRKKRNRFNTSILFNQIYLKYYNCNITNMTNIDEIVFTPFSVCTKSLKSLCVLYLHTSHFRLVTFHELIGMCGCHIGQANLSQLLAFLSLNCRILLPIKETKAFFSQSPTAEYRLTFEQRKCPYI